MQEIKRSCTALLTIAIHLKVESQGYWYEDAPVSLEDDARATAIIATEENLEFLWLGEKITPDASMIRVDAIEWEK